VKQALGELAEQVGVPAAAAALGVPRSTAYRWRKPAVYGPRRPRPKPRRALSAAERAKVLEVLHSERFVDKAPATIHSMLLDDNEYLCHPRTMYRILADEGEVRERRDQLRHPTYTRPELLATAPNQVWTWDVTWLRGPAKYVYYRLYVILDLYSRFNPGWMLAHEESGELAAKLIREACQRHRIIPGSLKLHADRGSVQKGKTVKQMLADLDVVPSFSRPRVSNDNPFSEAQFHTMKYGPEFPNSFASFEQARAFCRRFFHWYNHEHRHSGIAYLTPADVFLGRAEEIIEQRKHVMHDAMLRTPERFVAGAPKVHGLPKAVWINPPENRAEVELGLP